MVLRRGALRRPVRVADDLRHAHRISKFVAPVGIGRRCGAGRRDPAVDLVGEGSEIDTDRGRTVAAAAGGRVFAVAAANTRLVAVQRLGLTRLLLLLFRGNLSEVPL